MVIFLKTMQAKGIGHKTIKDYREVLAKAGSLENSD